MTLIAFLGSVFSPYYAAARRRGPTNPLDYCALNVVLHDRGAQHWTLTERRCDEIEQQPSSLVIGPSRLEWKEDRLRFDIDETSTPWLRPVRGSVTFTPFWVCDRRIPIDSAGRHVWRPIAPRGHVAVDMQIPSMRWRGAGYLDSNSGEEPLEAAFTSWHWSRSQLTDSCVVLYDLRDLNGDERSMAMRFDPAGQLTHFDAPERCVLPPSGWRVPRQTRSDDRASTRITQTLLDAPFYARSVLQTRLLGQSATSIHESLSLHRFRSAWVQSLLRFRIARLPRRAVRS